MTAATNKIRSIEKAIVAAKRKGLTDREIGKKFGVNFQEIERAVTKVIGVNVSLPNRRTKAISSLYPKVFSPETTTVWSFKSRGNWATHNGNYRGNWSPYIPRNVITRFSKEGQVILDCFCGSGATAIECKLLNRNFIGVDVNPGAIKMAKENTGFTVNLSPSEKTKPRPKITLKIGDARDLSFIHDRSVDLICTHPPYADIIQYTDDKDKNKKNSRRQDLSFLEIEDFLGQVHNVARENHRVLKKDGHCAVLIGDMRKNKNVVPLGFRLIDIYLQSGFVLKELIIKRQHNCRTTGFWYKSSIKHNFLLLAHEYLAVFRKDDGAAYAATSSPTKADPPLSVGIEEEDDNNSNNSEHKRNVSAIGRADDGKLETTTVWIFQPSDWYQSVLRNLVQRYNGQDHFVIFRGKEAAMVDHHQSHSMVMWDLLESKSVLNPDAKDIEGVLDRVNDGGYLAILCNDKRQKDGTIFPSALNITKAFGSAGPLRIKEIIVVSPESSGCPPEMNNNSAGDDNLNINHKYVLVYQKRVSQPD
ncbi:MAG TPA: DNA methyltransferase [Nitrososphaera sp.]|nr:DNA methyltransferase [Nitrososphaera sp.]